MKSRQITHIHSLTNVLLGTNPSFLAVYAENFVASFEDTEKSHNSDIVKFSYLLPTYI